MTGTELLKPAAEDRLRMWPVSRRVNKTGTGDDDPGLIGEVAGWCPRSLQWVSGSSVPRKGGRSTHPTLEFLVGLRPTCWKRPRKELLGEGNPAEACSF